MNLRLALACLLLPGVQCQSPFRLSGYVAESFFDSNRGVEASGLDIAPDGSHLVAVGDNGDVMFLNLNDDEGHCVVDLGDDVDGWDFEGVAIDPGSWTPNDMHAYIVYEGSRRYEPYLYKIKYEFNPGVLGSCSARVVDSKSLYDAIPCLRTRNGIESLGLKSPSSDTAPAVFFVGIQDSGKVYEVTSEGLSNGRYCYDGGVGDDDISASAYNSEYNHLWNRMESKDTIAVVDPSNDCTVATYKLGYRSEDEEGMAFDWTNGRFYLAVDGQGDGSYIAAYNFTYPDDLDLCVGNRPRSCTNFALCGGASFPITTTTTTSSTTTTTTTSPATTTTTTSPATTTTATSPATTTTKTSPETTTTATSPATTTTATSPATTTSATSPVTTTTTTSLATTTSATSPATTTSATSPATTTTTTSTAQNPCGDSRFEESGGGKRYGREIERFRRTQVGTVEDCSDKCANTLGCLGIRWNPRGGKPCMTLKGNLNKKCISHHVCCTQV